MDRREAARMLQRRGARGRGAEWHRAAESAEERGRHETDHRASRRTGRGHIVVRVPSLSSVSTSRLHLVGFIEAQEEAVQLMVRGVRRPVRGTPNRVLIMQESIYRSEAQVFRAHVPPRGICDNLISALKLLAKQSVGSVGGESSRTKQNEDDGRAEKVHHGR